MTLTRPDSTADAGPADSTTFGRPAGRWPSVARGLFRRLLRGTIPTRLAGTWISLVCAALAAIAIAIHVPGQVTMDTSIQLEEARVGRSLSFNPPFMSAVLRWLGGGELGTASLVLLCSVGTYGGLALASRAVLARREASGSSTVPLLRIAAVTAILANPILLIYVGIVWKDVLLAAMLMAGVAAGLMAWASAGRAATLWATGSVAILAASLGARQQGIFLAPCLALVPLIALRTNPAVRRRPLWLTGAAAAAIFLLTAIGVNRCVARTIKPSDNTPGPDYGFQVLMNFDLAGMVAMSPLPTAELAVPITEEQRQAVRASHTAARIDHVNKSPVASAWLMRLAGARAKHWRAMVAQNPWTYLAHRADAFGHLIGWHGIAGCLPLAIGASGNPAFLDKAGIPAVRDARDLLLYRFASTFFNWPVYRHWFWCGMLFAACVVLRSERIPPGVTPMGRVLALACLLLLLSFLPTMIACDFRYLFPVIPLVSLLWSMLLLSDKASAGDG